jgi:hypothetical protein
MSAWDVALYAWTLVFPSSSEPGELAAAIAILARETKRAKDDARADV